MQIRLLECCSMPKNSMQHAYNPQNDIDTGQSIKCTAFARKTWPKKIGVSGFSYMVRRYPVKAVKAGNWCLTVCHGVQTLSTDIFGQGNTLTLLGLHCWLWCVYRRKERRTGHLKKNVEFQLSAFFHWIHEKRAEQTDPLDENGPFASFA